MKLESEVVSIEIVVFVLFGLSAAGIVFCLVFLRWLSGFRG